MQKGLNTTSTLAPFHLTFFPLITWGTGVSSWEASPIERATMLKLNAAEMFNAADQLFDVHSKAQNQIMGE